MKKINITEITITALCIAFGVALPQIFLREPELGQVFLPMHLSVLLCGLLVSWKWSALCGISTPLICSLIFGRPVLFPVAAAMCFELLTYGVISSLLYKKTNIYISLIGAMFAGRLVNGVVNIIIFAIQGVPYTFKIFITTSFVKGIAGVIIQLIIIPIIVLTLQKAKVVNKRNG